jgi:hypothetical protein
MDQEQFTSCASFDDGNIIASFMSRQRAVTASWRLQQQQQQHPTQTYYLPLILGKYLREPTVSSRATLELREFADDVR